MQNLPTLSPSTQAQVSEIQSRFPDFKSFCSRFTPQNAATGAQHPTQCVTCNAPTLTYLNLAYGDGKAIAWLIWHLTFFQEHCNVPNKMSPMQLETCAQTIFDTYFYLKTSELMLFLARLLGGMYPVDWYGSITPTKIVSAIRDHFMPWRNDLLHKIEKREQQRRSDEEARNPGVTWEEYCRMSGRDPADSPFNRIKQ